MDDFALEADHAGRMLGRIDTVPYGFQLITREKVRVWNRHRCALPEKKRCKFEFVYILKLSRLGGHIYGQSSSSMTSVRKNASLDVWQVQYPNYINNHITRIPLIIT